MSALIEALNLGCGYPSRPVLSGINLTLNAGEVVALLGPNGSGKSTLLKTLSGTLRGLEGDVRVDGISLAKLSYRERGRRIGFVPQEELPTFPFLARQIVMMGRIPHSPGFFDAPQDWPLAREAMIRADCLAFTDRPVTELSGGERQRVLIARALASEAKILLLDEPSSHLDVGHVLSLVGLLRELACASHGIMLAVHDLNLAAMIADRAVLLGNGRIRADGAIHEVLRSGELDEVYGVDFERMTTGSGQLRVFART